MIVKGERAPRTEKGVEMDLRSMSGVELGLFQCGIVVVVLAIFAIVLRRLFK